MAKEVFIVAGGPSLKNFDWGKLANKDVIAINRAYEVLPTANYIYFADYDFFYNHEEGLTQHLGKIITGYGQQYCKSKIEHPLVENYTLTGANGLDTTPKCIRHGRNSGYAAINVAYHLGYKTIYLLGYDMQRTNGQTHWHDGHRRIDPASIYDTMLTHYGTLVEPLKNLNINVYNTSKESRLKMFPYVPLEQALAGTNKRETIRIED